MRTLIQALKPGSEKPTQIFPSTQRTVLEASKEKYCGRLPYKLTKPWIVQKHTGPYGKVF